MTDFSLMLPTVAISFVILLFVFFALNRGMHKKVPNSRKTSYTTNDESYFFDSYIYDDSHHHSGGFDSCGGGDFGGDCGGCDCG